MLTADEKIQIIDDNLIFVDSITNVLLDALAQDNYSSDGDYIALLYLQRKYLKKIRALF